MIKNFTTVFCLFLIIIGGLTVKSEDAFYFTDTYRNGLYKMDFAGGPHTSIPVQNLINPIAVAYDSRSNTVYVTERGGASAGSQKFIAMYAYNSGSTVKKDLPRASVPDGLAFDPISNLLFYCDTHEDIIGVLSSDLSYNSVIIRDRLEEPRGLAVDPLEGYVFWTDWSVSNAHIGRAFMDGSDVRLLVTSGLGWPNGLTLDRTGPVKHLYWCDAGFDKIERCNTDGSDRRTIFATTGHFFGIAADESYLYFTDWFSSAIQRIPKNGAISSENLGQVFAVNTTRFNGLVLSKQSLTITGSNACSSNNGGCQHLCLPSGSNTKVCHCSEGYVLSAEGMTCDRLTFERGLVISDQDKKGLYVLDLDKNGVKRLPILGHDTPKDIAYDLEEDTAFWVDSKHRFVGLACVKGSCGRVLKRFSEDASSPDGIAIDRTAKEIYVVDPGIHAIKKFTYLGSNEKLLVYSGLEKPRSIALDTIERKMYWTDWGSTPKIERASMADGGGREDFVKTDLFWPNGLAIDLRGRRLFWAEGKYGKLEVQNLDGTGRRVIHENYGENFLALTYGSNSLYYSIPNRADIYAIDLDTNNVRKYGNERFGTVFGMDYFGTGESQPIPSFPPPTTTLGSNGHNKTGGGSGEEGGGEGGGVNQTLIISLSVSIGGVIVIAVIIVAGIICYKHLDSKISTVQGHHENPAFKLEEGASAPVQPKSDGLEYAEVRPTGPPPPAPRPPAPLPTTARAYQLPPVPREEMPHPYLGLPDVIGQSHGPPPLPSDRIASGYADRLGVAPDYAGLLRETREPEPLFPPTYRGLQS